MKAEMARGWGVRVGGARPYLAWDTFTPRKRLAIEACTEKYHKPAKVVMITLNEYRRLKRLDK